MPRRARERLLDIVEAGEAIASYVEGFDPEKFRRDRRTVDAVLRNIAVIGEAARSIPEDIRELRPEVPWVDIADMRNVVVHEYFGVDLEILWRTATVDVPELLQAIRDLASGLADDGGAG